MITENVIDIRSENVVSADNQQESLDNSIGHYIAGFFEDGILDV